MDTRTVTVMIVDLVDSTATIAAVPSVRMTEIMRDAAEPIRSLVERLGGTVIKFTGDGYLTTFRSATSALHAATQVVGLFSSQAKSVVGGSIKGCRVSLNICDVTSYENDILGEGVVVAARMEKYVPLNSVYVTSAVRDVAKMGEFQFEKVDDLILSGIPSPVVVYRLLTESYRGVERDVYLTVTDLIGMSKAAAELSLTELNRTLQGWVGSHRDCLRETSGRLRAVAGDNVISTHVTAEEAVDFLVRLQSAVDAYNARVEPGRALTFSSITCRGDLFVPDFGVAGPLVSGAFSILGKLAAGTKVITKGVFDRLASSGDSFSGHLAEGLVGNDETLHVLRGL
ncbi:adenylate/guanylate cyclase domain-containing protein [Micromonospora sp. NPDC049051]|uniref:adenylate/guanylate cyclase domain-containing protein n=1 Tax=Micromonospora sp. NPDC049051 TaxID=3364264 RepID=UPI00371D015B